MIHSLSQWTDCTAGLDDGTDGETITAPSTVAIPPKEKIQHKKTSRTSIVMIIGVVGGVVGGLVAIVFVSLSSVWWKRQRYVEDEVICDDKGDMGGMILSDEDEGDEARSSFTTTTTAIGSSIVIPNRAPANTLWHDDVLMAWHISADGLEDIRVIGTGGYGVVYLVRDRRGRLLASKRLVQDHITRAKTRAFIDEIKLVARFDHPCIVTFIGAAWTTEVDLQALFEYMPNGDLCTYLAKTRPDDGQESWNLMKLQIAREMTEALVYVHSFRVTTRTS